MRLESRRGGRAGWHSASALNSRPIPSGATRRCGGGQVRRPARGGGRAGQHGGAAGQAQALQEHALRQRPMRRGAGRAGGRGQGREIHMRGEVGAAGLGQRVGRARRRASPAGCRRGRSRPGRNRGTAAAPPWRRAGGRGARHGLARPRPISRTAPSGGRRAGGRRRGTLDEGAVGHEALRPAVAAADELADRQGVEELVGQQDQRAVAAGSPPSSCQAAPPAQQRLLRGAQRGARSRPDAAAAAARKPGTTSADGAQRVGHQRAAAGARLAQSTGSGRAHLLPGHRRTRRRGTRRRPGEISGAVVKSPPPKGSRAGVIGRGGPRHEGVEPLHAAQAGDGDRPGAQHQPERRPASIGSDSSWPIVAPAKRKPRCASGWRKNSPMMRATP